MDRVAQLLEDVTPASRILELAPRRRPLAPKAADWRTTIVDCLPRNELAAMDGPGNPAVIEDVDFIWTAGSLHDALPVHLHKRFDTIIGSGVIGNVVDLVGFFASAAILLNESGTIALAVPDKRYGFDYFRTHTTTGDVLAAIGTTRPSLKEVFDDSAYALSADHGRFRNGWQTIAQALMNDLTASDRPYAEIPRWQFTPASFELLLLELGQLGIVDWHIGRNAAMSETDFAALRP
jgi:hypothetical protein